MVQFSSADIYVESCKSLNSKIQAIDAIITALLSQALKAASKGPVSQYTLNDGQTIINCSYRSAGDVAKSIKEFQTIKQMFINQRDGNMMRLVDSKNFTNGNFF